MTNKFIIKGDETLETLSSGLRLCAEVVGATMGPHGSLVVKSDQFQPVFTKDGASVLDSMNPDEPIDQIVVRLLRDAALKGVRAAGDGTTSTTVLASAMVEWGMARLKCDGTRRRDVVDELRADVTELIDLITESSTPVVTEQDHYRVTIISTNGDEEMARISAKAAIMVGEAGKINIKPGVDREDRLDHEPGVRYNRGVAHHGFLPSDGNWNIETQLIVVEEELTLQGAGAIVQTCQPKHKVVVMAPSYADDALQILGQANMFIPVRMEGAGNAQRANLADLAHYAECSIVSPAQPFDVNTSVSMPVHAHITSTECVISGKPLPEEYMKGLKAELKAATSSYDKDMLEVRIARLTGGVANIFVAGDTEAEMEERIHRYDDATKSALSAARDGCSIGGGYAYLKLPTTLADKCQVPPHWSLSPIYKVMENAEEDIGIVLNAFRSGECLNLRDDQYVKEESYSVVDATMAQISALKTASSLARMILSSRAITRTGIPGMSIS